MSHTPGPWAIHHDGKPLFGYWHIRQDPKDWDGHGYQAICTLPADKKGTHYGEMFAANARLIAAAPELLAALMRLANEVDASMPLMEPLCRREFGNTNYQCIMDAVSAARIALAKATGVPLSSADRTEK